MGDSPNEVRRRLDRQWSDDERVRARQLELLPAYRDAPEPPVDRQETQVQPEKQEGPGRRKGSRNRRTKDIIKYMATKGYVMPLERLAQIYSADPQELAAAFNLSLIEALELIKSSAVASLPYLHQKQPVAVDIEGKGTFQLVIGDIGGADPDELDDGLSMVLDLQATEVGDDEKDEGNSDG